MHKVVERTRIVPNIHLLRVEAPAVVRKVVPGNFVIVKIGASSPTSISSVSRLPRWPARWCRATS
jgi:NAD(P)H-flavin reductase